MLLPSTQRLFLYDEVTPLPGWVIIQMMILFIEDPIEAR
jgi:hypothetical protein